MKMYPTRFEIVDAGDALGKVEMFDEMCATVSIRDCAFTLESWREFSSLVEDALIKMDLESTETPMREE
jgi:hypothetical protein